MKHIPGLLPFSYAGDMRNILRAGLIIKLKWRWLAKLYQVNLHVHPAS